MFKLNSGVELKTGDVVVVRFYGDSPVYMMYFNEYAGYENILVNCMSDVCTYMNAATVNYEYSEVIKVYRPDVMWAWPFVNGAFQESLYNVIYDNVVKELTVAEISRFLGYKVKVVEEDQKGCS